MRNPSISGRLQEFFICRLINQQNASPRTIASYRDTFRLLLRFLAEQTHKQPCELTLQDVSTSAILEFLEYLETERGNGPTTRNIRLAAIRSFFRYLSYIEVEAAGEIQQVLALPMKRFDHRSVAFLTIEEIEAILAVPSCSTWGGVRDQAMLTLMYNTGARVSEITALRIGDITWAPKPFVRIQGKGRKERVVPIWRRTAHILKTWLGYENNEATHPLFPNARGEPMSRFGIEHRLNIAVDAAAQKCMSLKTKRVTPHVIRHTTAMHLLQAGIDINTIALWLGHESPVTTHQYLEADLAMKERVLAKLDPPNVAANRYVPHDSLLRFLETL